MYFWAQAWPLNYLLKKPVVTSVTQISCTEWDVLTNHQAGKWATTARVSLSAFLRVTPLDVCEDNTRYFKETWGHLHVCGDQSLIYFAISWFIYSHVCSNKLSPSIVLFVCLFFYSCWNHTESKLKFNQEDFSSFHSALSQVQLTRISSPVRSSSSPTPVSRLHRGDVLVHAQLHHLRKCSFITMESNH